MRSKARAGRIIQRKPGCISKGELVSGMRNLQCQPQIVFDFCPICSTHRESRFFMNLHTCMALNPLARLVLAGLVDNRETTDKELSFLNPETQQKTLKT